MTLQKFPYDYKTPTPAKPLYLEGSRAQIVRFTGKNSGFLVQDKDGKYKENQMGGINWISFDKVYPEGHTHWKPISSLLAATFEKCYFTDTRI